MVELVRDDSALEPPPDRGRLMSPEQVARELFAGLVKPRWVRENVTPKVRLGASTTLFYEADVRAWIESRRQGVA